MGIKAVYITESVHRVRSFYVIIFTRWRRNLCNFDTKLFYNICSKTICFGILINRRGRTEKNMAMEGTEERGLQLKIDQYGDMLFKLSYIRLQNVQDAEDVVQEVFYQYIKNPQTFQSPEHEKAWLLKVAMNACRKVWRSAWRRHRSDWQPEGEQREERWPGASCPDLKSYDPGPEEAAFQKEEKSQLLNAVLALPAKYRDVIHLFYYEELSVKEIAKVTGRAESTVTSQLTRGRELLRKALHSRYEM